MYKRLGTIFIVLLLCLSSISLAHAASCPLHKRGNDKNCPACKMEKMEFDEMFFHKLYFIGAYSEEIKLTDEQKEDLKALKYRVRKDLIMKDADIDTYALEIKETLEQDQISKEDLARLNEMIDKKYEVKKEKAKVIALAYSDLKKVITVDQLRKLKAIWDECMKESEKDMLHEKSGLLMKKEMTNDKNKR